MITVDLNFGAAGSGENQLRRDVLERVMTKLATKPDDIEEKDDPFAPRPLELDVMARRNHDAILVSARRGDGKTTFLTNVLRLIEGGRDTYIKALPNAARANSASLYSLGIVDPTLIETKQNIIVIIIEKIKAAADRAYKLDSTAKKKDYEAFKEALQRLAAGIGLIDGIGDEAPLKEWGDAAFVLERGLDHARDASKFERVFHALVRCGAKVVGHDAFVIAIDDVDTSFERGWPVLEALRKYLATPRLKVVLAGDLKLYNLLVRQQQWKQVTRDYVEVENRLQAKNLPSYLDQLAMMVPILQDQYLVKIIKPENRFELRPLLALAEDDLRFKRTGDQEPEGRRGPPGLSQSAFMTRYSRELLAVRAQADRDLVRAAILRLPLRSSLQAIDAAWPLVRSIGRDRDEADEATYRQQALEGLASVAATALQTRDLDTVALEDSDPDRVLAVLANWLASKGGWPSRGRFHPDGVDEAEDIARLLIAARLVDAFRQHPSAMIDYWLRLCTIREIVDRGEVEVGPQLDSLIEHIGANTTTERSLQLVSRLAAWDQGSGQQVARRIRLSGAVVPAASRVREANAVAFELYGIVGRAFPREVFRTVVDQGNGDAIDRIEAALPPPLRGFHGRLLRSGWNYSSKRGLEAGFIGSFGNSLDSLTDLLEGDAAVVAMIPGSRITSGQGAENGVYSVLRLIAFIGDLLKLDAEEAGDDASELEREVALALAHVRELRSYPTPARGDSAKIEAEDLDEPSDELDDGDFGPDASETGRLARSLAAWLLRIHEGGGIPPVAPVSLARIWTRFVYAHGNIVNRLSQTKTRYLGVLMHRSITAFLHAVGLESLRANAVELPKNVIGNPITGSEVFANLLDFIAEPRREDDSKKPRLSGQLFDALFSCPLWGFFLARSDEEITGKKDVRGQPADRVYRHYLEAVAPYADASLFEVQYGRSYSENSVTFPNLFAILNTVQIQGGISAGRNQVVVGTGNALLELLRVMPAEAPDSGEPNVSGSEPKPAVTIRRPPGRPPKQPS